MEAPLTLTTRKRQSTFILIAFTYLCVYAFDIQISQVSELGLSIAFPGIVAEFILFVASIFLFARYAADGWAELAFFDWYSKNNDQHNHNRSAIAQVEAMQRHIDSGDSPYFQELITHTQPTLLPAALSNFRSKLAYQLRQNDIESFKQLMIDNREWLQNECQDALIHLKHERFLLRTRWSSVTFVLLFDVAVPALLIILVLIAGLFEPTWLKYAYFVTPSESQA